MIPQFDDGGRLEHPIHVNDKLTMLERINVAFNEEEIRTALHWQEAFAWNVDPVCVLEVLDRCASGSFEL